MAIALSTSELCKTYIVNKRQNNVLKNVSLTVEEGEMVAVMGPSGSGKSTLLYTASGMDTVTFGSVRFFGRELSALSDDAMADLRLTEMGFVFQQMHMLKSLTVLDNIILPAFQAKRADRKAIVARAEALMKKLGIIELANNDIREASGGELQRACICRSLINSPRMIFADEPTGALNRQASEEVMAEFCRINAEGVTILLVTHDAKVAAKCSQVLYLVDGSIRGAYTLGRMEKEASLRERERLLNTWLMEMGW